MGASSAIVVGLHQISSQLQQQLFDFHGLNRFTFCQSGASVNIVVALRQIPCQIQQQLFDFHDLNILFDLLSEWVQALALWLGYTNSMLNPIIYSVLHRQASSLPVIYQ